MFEGRYSKDKTDLANMSLEQFNEALSGLVAAFAKKLKASENSGSAYIALLMQPTQWNAPDRAFVDHVGDMLRLVSCQSTCGSRASTRATSATRRWSSGPRKTNKSWS